MEHKNKSCTVFNWQKNTISSWGSQQSSKPSSAPAFLQDLVDLFPVKSLTLCLLSFRTLSNEATETSSGPAFTWNVTGSAWTSGSHCDCSQSTWQLGFSYHILWGPHISEQPTTTTCFSIWDCKSDIKFSMKTSLQLQYYFKRHLYYKKI